MDESAKRGATAEQRAAKKVGQRSNSQQEFDRGQGRPALPTNKQQPPLLVKASPMTMRWPFFTAASGRIVVSKTTKVGSIPKRRALWYNMKLERRFKDEHLPFSRSSSSGGGNSLTSQHSFKETAMADVIEQASERLGVSCLGVFERAAVGDTARDAHQAWLTWFNGGRIMPWAEQWCKRALETREETLTRVED